MFFVSGLRTESPTPRLAERYFSMSFVVERSDPACAMTCICIAGPRSRIDTTDNQWEIPEQDN